MNKLFCNLKVSTIAGIFLMLCSLAGSIFTSSVQAKNLEPPAQEQIEGVIAYIEVDGDIYLLFGNTNERFQLTSDANQYYYNSPKFSPNGRYLAFLKSDPQKGESKFDLNVMDLETRETKRLVENVDDWGNYDWSPDSQSLVFGYSIEVACHDVDQETTFGILQVWLENGEIKELIPPASPNAPFKKPAFSYDGKWISFESYPCFSEGFNVNTRNLSTNETFGFGISEINWSPDQNSLALTRDVWAGGNGGLSITTPDQDQEQLIQEAGELAFGDLHWSPDGSWIAVREHTKTDGMFIITDENETLVWEDYLVLHRSDGSQNLQICSSEEIWGCHFVAWSPDGRQFIYQVITQNNIDWYLYTLATNETTSLPEFGDSDLDWMPISRLPQSFFPTAEPTQQLIAPQPTITPSGTVVPEIPNKLNFQSILPFLCGIGLIFASIILVFVLVIVKRKK